MDKKTLEKAAKAANFLNHQYVVKYHLNDGRHEPHHEYFHGLTDAKKFVRKIREAYNMDIAPNCGASIYDKNGKAVSV